MRIWIASKATNSPMRLDRRALTMPCLPLFSRRMPLVRNDYSLTRNPSPMSKEHTINHCRNSPMLFLRLCAFCYLAFWGSFSRKICAVVLWDEMGCRVDFSCLDELIHEIGLRGLVLKCQVYRVPYQGHCVVNDLLPWGCIRFAVLTADKASGPCSSKALLATNSE